MVNLGVEVNLGPRVADALRADKIKAQFRVNNLADALYTTFGYFDGYQPVWIPSATRNAYAGLVFDW